MNEIKANCKQCQKDFLIIEQEQQFIKKMGLPLPVLCPSCRQQRRLQDRGERKLYRTKCQNCQKEIIVTYNPEKETRKILCKQCYLNYFEKNSPLITE